MLLSNWNLRIPFGHFELLVLLNNQEDNLAIIMGPLYHFAAAQFGQELFPECRIFTRIPHNTSSTGNLDVCC